MGIALGFDRMDISMLTLPTIMKTRAALGSNRSAVYLSHIAFHPLGIFVVRLRAIWLETSWVGVECENLVLVFILDSELGELHS